MNKNYQSGNLILKQTQEEGAVVLGDCNSALDNKIQKLYKIQTIISIGQQALPPKQKIPENIFHKFYDIHDNKSQKVPPQLFDQIYDHIQNGRKKGGVLVHCYAGVSRSSSFVIAYIMRKKFYDYDKSKQLVKKQRSCIHPGDGFIHQLKNYWKILEKREEQRLKLLQKLNKKYPQQSQSEIIELSPSKRRGLRGAVKIADVPLQKIKQIQSKRKEKDQIAQKDQKQTEQHVLNIQKKQQNQSDSKMNIQKIQHSKMEQLNNNDKKDYEQNRLEQMNNKDYQKQLKKQQKNGKIKKNEQVKIKSSYSQLQKQNNTKTLPKNAQKQKVIITDKKIITKNIQKISSQTKGPNPKRQQQDILNKKSNSQMSQKKEDKYQQTKSIYNAKTKVL